MTDPQTPTKNPGTVVMQKEEVLSLLSDKRPASKVDERPPLRQRIGDGIKTLLWVAPITALVWIYAEREQIDTRPDVAVTVTVKPTSADRIVTLAVPSDGRVFLDLKGPRASIDAVRSRLAEKSLLDIQISEEAGYEGEIPAAERLSQDDIFLKEAVQVTSVRPSIRVHVEARRTRQIPVKGRNEDQIVGTVNFEPETVAIEGPASVIDQLAAETVAYANLSSIVGRKPGKHTETVPLIQPTTLGRNVKIVPANVKAVVEITQTSATYQIQSVPVFVLVPSRVLETDRIKIQTRATLPNVDVVGPPESIKQIQDGAFVPSVIVELSTADLTTLGEKQIKIKSEHYRMPKDVAVVNGERELAVTLTDRSGE